MHLHTTRVTEGNREVHEGIRETLAAITAQLEAPTGTSADQTARTVTHRAQQAATATAIATAETLARVARSPLAVTGQVLGDLTDSARRPDTVLYWTGLAGAAVLGALEWPVAVALGIGVAVACGRRGTPSSGP